MATYGVLYENGNSSAVFGKKYNKSFKSATVDFDGGNLIHGVRGVDDVYTANVPTTGNLKGLYMAYNPSERYIKINNLKIAGQPISVDPRNYTNLAGTVGDMFKLEIGDEAEILKEGIVGEVAPTVGQFLEARNGSKLLTISATQTADTTSFKVVKIANQAFPQAHIGEDNQPRYILECMFN